MGAGSITKGSTGEGPIIPGKDHTMEGLKEVRMMTPATVKEGPIQGQKEGMATKVGEDLGKLNFISTS